MQIGFYFDQTRCIGCYTCSVACKDWHDIEAGSANWKRVTAVERGKYPELFVAFVALSCLHCKRPACIPACPVNAITKRENDGIVVVDQEACLGNLDCPMYCKEACPYDVPQFGDEDGSKMQKCHLCVDRWSEGRKPVCVEACPMRALDAGPLDELEAKYGKAREAEGFVYSPEVEPAIIFKPRQSPKE